MAANSNNPQSASDTVESTSNKSQMGSDFTGQRASESSNAEPPAVSLNVTAATFSLNSTKWVVLGVFAMLTLATLFLLTKGSQFCFFFSSCTEGATIAKDSFPINLLAYGAGTAALIFSTIYGVPLTIAVAASLGVWLLIEMVSQL